MSNEGSPGVDYVSFLADLKARREALDKAIAGIEAYLGHPQSGGTPVTQAIVTESVTTHSFLGMNIADAAAKLLAMKKSPLTTNEIADFLKNGGMVGSDNFANSVGVALHRANKNSDGDIMRIGRGKWGLAAWYPGKKRNGKKNNEGTDNAGSDES